VAAWAILVFMMMRTPDIGLKSWERPVRERPPRIKEPNAESLAAIEELDSGKGKRVATVEELMAELNAED